MAKAYEMLLSLHEFDKFYPVTVALVKYIVTEHYLYENIVWEETEWHENDETGL